MKTFASCKDMFRPRNGANHYHVINSEIDIYFWNTGKNANFLVTAGYSKFNKKQKSFSKGPAAREAAIDYALALKDRYPGTW
jgi:hypothetical protein